MHDLDTGITPTSVQMAVGPVHYAIALRPEDPAQLRTAVDLACRWWGGISFPWLTLNSDGEVTGGTEQLCSVLDVAEVIDLTRPDDRDPIPAGLKALGIQVTAGDLRPRWAMPIRGVVAPDTSDPLITAGAGEDDDLAQAAAVGTLGPDESDCWAKIGQPVPRCSQHPLRLVDDTSRYRTKAERSTASWPRATTLPCSASLPSTP